MRSPVVVALVALFAVSAAHAQSNSQAKIQPHLVPVGGSNLCSPANALVPCSGIRTAGDLNPALYYAYVLVTDGNPSNGVAGLQFGIDYNGTTASGVDIFNWTRCADLDFPMTGWPGAGSGSLITWSPSLHCQGSTPGGPGTGVVAAAGYFYLAAYTPDALRIIPHPLVGNAKVADCGAAESILPLSSLGTAQFSAGAVVPGFSPCAGSGPPEPTCSISGPSTVLEGSSRVYSVSFSVSATSISWSVSGNATISGPTSGSSVSVLAGTVGSFTLRVDFTSSTGTWSCTRTISVDAAFCSISGSSIVVGNTTNSYSFSSNVSNPQITWSVTGNGSIVGSNTGTQVSVLAALNGQFTVTATFTGSNGSGVCSKVVSINNQVFTCAITGPASVAPGSTGNAYSVSTEITATSILWSISGSGTIVGPATASQVSVTAGASGSFTLSVTYSGPGANGTCSKTVAIQAPGQMTCSIGGPTELPEGGTSSYSVSSNPAGDGWSWTVSGNGSINGSSTGSSVQVHAGSAGFITLRVTVTSGSLSTQCSMNILVYSTQPEGPNQGTAKIVVHLTAPSAKNSCAVHPPCYGIATSGTLAPITHYYAYLLVADGYTSRAPRSGVAGAQFGIQYNAAPGAGVDVYSWSLCADLEFPSTGWPGSGTGNLVTWDGVNHCQQYEPGGLYTGVVATLGFFYMGAYTPDNLVVIPRPVDGAAKVANCYAAESLLNGSPSHLGMAGFGGAPGYNPCGSAIPVQPTTWGRIKSMMNSK